MVMTWNADADAKLLLGVIDQMRHAKVKLDNEKLAAFMGPECTPSAIQNRLVRLGRRAEAGAGSSWASSPATTPQKRQIGSSKTPTKAPSPKKSKAIEMVIHDESGDDEDYVQIKQEVTVIKEESKTEDGQAGMSERRRSKSVPVKKEDSSDTA